MNEKEQKAYAPISAREITFQSSGKTILKMGINVAKLKAWLDEHVNEKGYVNLGISSRKEVSQYGETHTVWLDTWKPDGRSRSKIDDADVPRRVVPTAPEGKSFDDGDDLEVPF
jgi:hypothetical protein